MLLKMKKLFSVSEAAEEMGVDPATMRRWEREGKLIPERTTGGHRRYHREALHLARLGVGSLNEIQAKTLIELVNAPNIPTYVPRFDANLPGGGLRPQWLWNIGATEEKVASDFAIYSAARAANDGVRTLYLSFRECLASDLLLQAALYFNPIKIKATRDLAEGLLKESLAKNFIPLVLRPSDQISPQLIKELIRKEKDSTPVRMVVIDSIADLTLDSDASVGISKDQNRRVEYLAEKLFHIGKEMNVLMVLLTHPDQLSSASKTIDYADVVSVISPFASKTQGQKRHGSGWSYEMVKNRYGKEAESFFVSDEDGILRPAQEAWCHMKDEQALVLIKKPDM